MKPEFKYKVFNGKIFRVFIKKIKRLIKIEIYSQCKSYNSKFNFIDIFCNDFIE